MLLIADDEPRINAMLKYVNGDNILNVGFVGKPVLHSYLFEKYLNVVGIDLDENGILEFKKQGYNVLKMDAEDLKFDRNFDTIIAGELIEHLCNPGKFLLNCRKHLSENGRLIMSTPNPFSLGIFTWMIFTGKLQNPEHVAWHDKETLTVLLTRAGFIKLNFIYSPPQIKTLGANSVSKIIFFSGALFSNIIFRLGAKKLGGTNIVIVAESKVYRE